MVTQRLAPAREAFARQDWKRAYAALSVADETHAQIGVEDLERLALSASMLGKDKASAGVSGARRTCHPSAPVIVAGLLVMCLSATATAQSTVTGAIAGTVTEPGRAATERVDVLASNIDTTWEASATTDSQGRFRIIGLQPGRYTVAVNVPSFKSLAVTNVVVEVGRVTTVDISLESPDAGAAPAAQLVPDQHHGPDFSINLTETSFDDLPNNGRRWSNFAILAPATTVDGLAGGSASSASAAC